MKRSSTFAIAAASLVAGFALGNISSASAQLDKILKGGAVLAIVDSNGGAIDKFVNKITNTKNDDPKFDTKVVPILSVGKGAFAGAAQVSGPKKLVQSVRAVAQVEGDMRLGFRVRARGLIPIADRNISSLSDLKRVSGVGLTATVEIKL